MRDWWRVNRLWLAALPVALALMTVASGYNVPDFLYRTGPHHELASAGVGEFVDVTVDYDDAVGRTSRTFRVRANGIASVAQYPFGDGERAPAEGLQAITLQLDWAAAPDQVLLGCTVQLEDDQGRRYGLLVDSAQPSACVPDGASGPSAPLLAGEERGQTSPYEDPRPATWSTAPVFLVPQGREITRALVWWQLPDYAALSVS